MRCENGPVPWCGWEYPRRDFLELHERCWPSIGINSDSGPDCSLVPETEGLCFDTESGADQYTIIIQYDLHMP